MVALTFLKATDTVMKRVSKHNDVSAMVTYVLTFAGAPLADDHRPLPSDPDNPLPQAIRSKAGSFPGNVLSMVNKDICAPAVMSRHLKMVPPG
jgi:hypothetical protein